MRRLLPARQQAGGKLISFDPFDYDHMEQVRAAMVDILEDLREQSRVAWGNLTPTPGLRPESETDGKIVD
jgi:putative NADH-flavin reductase